MAGKYLERGAITDTMKSEESMNAVQKREGKTKHHVDVVPVAALTKTVAHFTS